MRQIIMKYILASLLLLISTVFVVQYFISVDPHDSPLWAGLVMALLGLVAGGLVNIRRK